MKLKNIFLIVSAAGMLFSCTDIRENDPALPEDGEVVLNLAVTPKDVTVSRAAGDIYDEDGKVYFGATDEEKTINSCLLVVFDQNDNVYWWNKYDAPSHTDYIYTLPDVKAKIGDARFLIIANGTADYDALLVKGTPYANFEDADITETDATATFTPSSLVKVGQLETTVSAATTSVEVPLTQLAARVDVTFKFAPEGGTATMEKEVSFESLNEMYVDATNKGVWYWLILYGTTLDGGSGDVTLDLKFGEQTFPVNVQYGDIEAKDGNYFYYNDEKVSWSKNPSKGVVMNDIYYKVRTTETSGWTVEVSDLTIHNIAAESSVILDYPGTQNTKKGLVEKNITLMPQEDGSYYFSLYTYEKRYVENDNLDEVLYVDFKTKWTPQAGKTTEQLAKYTLNGERKGDFYLIASKDGITPIEDNTNGACLIPVYKEGLDNLTAEQIAELIPVEGTEVTVEGEGEGSSGPLDATYRIKINPVEDPTSTVEDTTPKKFTDGLIHGNIYIVSGTIKEIPTVPAQDVPFEYAVVPWNNNVTVDIPTFN